MISAVLLTVGVISFFMVRCNLFFRSVHANYLQLFVAYLAGARFDIAYYQAKEQFGQLLGWGASNATKIAEVTKVVEAAPGHSEL
jgi:farnesyl-diphosphate farnesyltransferase